MIPSLSKPANPYANASCESFLKTLKREEIYANDYRCSRNSGGERPHAAISLC
jgi:transposase InsO family protein